MIKIEEMIKEKEKQAERYKILEMETNADEEEQIAEWLKELNLYRKCCLHCPDNPTLED